MGIRWFEGDARHEVVAQAVYPCAACEVAPIMITAVPAPIHQVTLDFLDESFADAALLAPQVACPECGGMLEVRQAALLITPDEPECPTLALVGDIDEGEITAREWRLLAGRVERVDGRPTPIALDGATTLGEDIDEERLQQAWGRPLDVRHAWRALIGQAMGDEGAVGEVMAPGLVVALIRAEVDLQAIDEESIIAAAERTGGALAAVIGGLAPTDDGWAPVPVMGAAREAIAQWAGPWAEALREPGRVMGVVAIAPDLLADWTTGMMEPLGFVPVDPPEGRTADEAFWMMRAGIPVGLELIEAVTTGIFEGITPAEAVARELGRLADLCDGAREVVDALIMDGEMTVTVHALDQVHVDLGDGGSASSNLGSVLAKTGVAGALAQLRGLTRVGTSGNMCGCGESWLMRALRTPGFADSYTPPGHRLRDRQEVTDARGTVFASLLVQDCPHHVGYMIEGRETIPADEIPGRLYVDTRRIRLEGRGYPLRGIDGQAVGVALTGPGVASVLVNPALGTQLLDEVARRVPLGPAPIADAPSTDCLILINADVAVDADEVIQTVTSRLGVGGPTPPAGSHLGYRGQLRREGRGAGRIHIAWQAEPLLF